MSQVFSMLLLLLPVLCQHAYALDDRPNIILIITDDLDKRSLIAMENVRTLLTEKGTTFSNYIIDVPNCCPSRASLLRGQFAHNTGVLTNGSPYGGFTKFRDSGLEKSTVATWLRKAGYRTALFGKYLNEYPSGDDAYVPPGWKDWFGIFKGVYFKYKINENGTIFSYGDDEIDYESDVLGQKAVDFIRTYAGKTPFFIYLAPHAPHKPFTPAPRHEKEFAGLSAPRAPSFNEADVSDKPGRIRALPVLTATQIREIDNVYRLRLRTLLAIDEMIAAIVDALTRARQLKNTYIFFTSDNGFHLGEHRIPIGKNTAYDESVNVPLIVRGPGVARGRIDPRLAQNIDLAPTFAQVAAANVPAFVDGQSLVALMQNAFVPFWKQEALVEHWDNDGIQDFLALRTLSYLYVEYNSTEVELYDIRTDPYQLRSLHATADRSLLLDLAAKLKLLATQ